MLLSSPNREKEGKEEDTAATAVHHLRDALFTSSTTYILISEAYPKADDRMKGKQEVNSEIDHPSTTKKVCTSVHSFLHWRSPGRGMHDAQCAAAALLFSIDYAVVIIEEETGEDIPVEKSIAIVVERNPHLRQEGIAYDVFSGICVAGKVGLVLIQMQNRFRVETSIIWCCFLVAMVSWFMDIVCL